jgi:hypothetical protein
VVENFSLIVQSWPCSSISSESAQEAFWKDNAEGVSEIVWRFGRAAANWLLRGGDLCAGVIENASLVEDKYCGRVDLYSPRSKNRDLGHPGWYMIKQSET